MPRLQASVFTSVNWDDLRVPRRIKPYKVWTSSPKGLGTGGSSADATRQVLLQLPASTLLSGLVWGPHLPTPVSLCFSPPGPGPRQMLWPGFSGLQVSACSHGCIS